MVKADGRNMNKNNFTNIVISNAFLLLGVMSISFIIRVINSHNLIPADFGLYIATISLYSIFITYSDLGVNNYIMIRMSYLKKKNDLKRILQLHKYNLKIKIIISIILITIIITCKGWLSNNYFKSNNFLELVPLFILMTISSFILLTYKVLFVSQQKVKIYQGIEVFKLFLHLITITTLIFLNNFNLYTLFASYAIITTACYTLYIPLFQREFSKLKIKNKNVNPLNKKIFWKQSTSLFLGNSISFLIGNIDIILITYMLSTNDVAMFSNAMAIVSIIIGLLLNIFKSIFIAQVSSLRDNYTKIKNMLKIIYDSTVVCVIPIVITILFYNKELITLLFSDKYVTGNTVLLILISGVIFKILYTHNINVLLGLEKIQNRNKLFLFALGQNIILNILLIPTYGIMGVAMATLSTWIVLFFTSYKYIAKMLSFKFDFSNMFKLILPTTIFLGLIVLQHHFLKIIPTTINYSIIIMLNSLYIIYCYKINVLPKKLLKKYFDQLVIKKEEI